MDAQTGAVVRQEERQTQLTYQDLSGHWAREAIESLAAYGVGYEGETFAPDQAMTQWDLVALLYSVTYYPTGSGRGHPGGAQRGPMPPPTAWGPSPPRSGRTTPLSPAARPSSCCSTPRA